MNFTDFSAGQRNDKFRPPIYRIPLFGAAAAGRRSITMQRRFDFVDRLRFPGFYFPISLLQFPFCSK